MPHCHCYNGTLRGHCALRGHCTTRGVGYMGLTKNEKNLLNQVSKELNKASKMHKSQADRIRSLGSARRVQMIGNTESKQVRVATAAFLGVVATSTLGGVVRAAYDGYFLGRARKKDVSYENIAKRNAALGSVFGTVIALAILTDD